MFILKSALSKFGWVNFCKRNLMLALSILLASIFLCQEVSATEESQNPTDVDSLASTVDSLVPNDVNANSQSIYSNKDDNKNSESNSASNLTTKTNQNSNTALNPPKSSVSDADNRAKVLTNPSANKMGQVSKKLDNDTLPMLNFLLGSFLVIGLIFGLAYLLKKLKLIPNQKEGQLKIISSLMVGPKEKVILIQVGEEQVLIGATPTQVNLLHKLEKNVTDLKSATQSCNSSSVNAENTAKDSVKKDSTSSGFKNVFNKVINNKSDKD